MTGLMDVKGFSNAASDNKYCIWRPGSQCPKGFLSGSDAPTVLLPMASLRETRPIKQDSLRHDCQGGVEVSNDKIIQECFWETVLETRNRFRDKKG
jgi:hypothetical protein